jgi:hypothetical protein
MIDTTNLSVEPRSSPNKHEAPSSSTTLMRSCALVGLKDVQVLAYRRRGPDVDLMVEQVIDGHFGFQRALMVASGDHWGVQADLSRPQGVL